MHSSCRNVTLRILDYRNVEVPRHTTIFSCQKGAKSIYFFWMRNCLLWSTNSLVKNFRSNSWIEFGFAIYSTRPLVCWIFDQTIKLLSWNQICLVTQVLHSFSFALFPAVPHHPSHGLYNLSTPSTQHAGSWTPHSSYCASEPTFVECCFLPCVERYTLTSMNNTIPLQPCIRFGIRPQILWSVVIICSFKRYCGIHFVPFQFFTFYS